MASASKHLDVRNGDQSRQFANARCGFGGSDSTSACTSRPTLCQNFFKDSVAGKLGGLSPSHLAALGTANTNWENELERTAVTHNHNLSFSGGGEDTRYRASLNFMNQEGVAISNGFQRVQGRLNATHNALDRKSTRLNSSH